MTQDTEMDSMNRQLPIDTTDERMPDAAPVVIRLAEECEREALEAIQRRASLSNPGDRDALLAHPDAIDLPAGFISAGRVFVAQRGKRNLGFAVVLPRPDGEAELDGLFVEPDAWCRGVGRLLVDYAAGYARSLGARILHVTGNTHAQGFYAKLGFVVVGEGQTRFGPAPLMQRPLS